MRDHSTPGDRRHQPFAGFPADGPTTLVDNDILDYVLPGLNAAQLRVYLTIVREWTAEGAEWVAISAAQFGQRTGLARSSILAAVWALYANKLIDRRATTTANGGTGSTLYRPLPVPRELRG